MSELRRFVRGLGTIAAVVASGIAVFGCVATRMEEGTPGAMTPRLGEASSGTEALLPVETLGVDLVLQQRVTIQWNGREEGFGAVLQKRGDELLLLGLGPMNSVGFRLALVGDEVSFDNRTGRELPFVPERILLDVQRVFYPWIDEAESASCSRCDRQGSRDGIEVVERIGASHLEERRFVIRDGPLGEERRTEVVVRYEAWLEDPRVPARAILSNGRFGYELLVETTSAERLD